MYKKFLKIFKIFAISAILFSSCMANDNENNNIADIEAIDFSELDKLDNLNNQEKKDENQKSKIKQLFSFLNDENYTWESKRLILSEMFKKHFSENKKKYVLGAVTVGTAGAGLLAYLIYNKCNKDDKK